MLSNPRVLMVDDDADLLEAARIALQAAGFEFRAAGSAAEALETLRQYVPDLLIVDIVLEDVFAGLRLLSDLRDSADPILRERFSRTCVLVHSGVQARTGMRLVPSERTRHDAFLEKPASLAKLVSTARMLIDRRAKAMRSDPVESVE